MIYKYSQGDFGWGSNVAVWQEFIGERATWEACTGLVVYNGYF